MYVAVKGGQKAIENAHRLLACKRRGDPRVPELGLEQIKEQLSFAVDRVMSEGSVYDPDLAALAIKQAQGDLPEAIFLLRAFRATLPRLGVSEPLHTGGMQVVRRISSAFKDLPGGQILGPTFDYTHRLLDFSLTETGEEPPQAPTAPHSLDSDMPKVVQLLDQDGLVEREEAAPQDPEPGDLTREPLTFPIGRDLRLQNLARADEGFLLAMGYSTQRGFGVSHPFAGELRMGRVNVSITPPELGFAVEIGEIVVTECDMLSKFNGNHQRPAQFTRGYGLSFGYNERKVMAMALVDRNLRATEMGEEALTPAQDQEFVLSHSDNVEAWGFTSHLKLPHHVDFQSEIKIVRDLRSTGKTADEDEKPRQASA
ncbi:MAG: carbon-phosphorus lyase complex subunit PhnI [Desulfarculaceae bacterium]